MKLYYTPHTCALAPHIALQEAGLPHELIAVDLQTRRLADGSDYHAINPLGYVPYLAFADGSGLQEVPALLQFIADQAPQKNLISMAGSMARYEQIAMLNFIATEIHKGLGPLWIPEVTEEAKTALKARVMQRLIHLDGILAQQRYLTGNNYGVDDIYGFVATGWPAMVGMDISALQNLNAWREKIAARPAVQAALKAEGLA